MKIHHVAIWANDLEKMKNFYINHFQCKPSNKYTNNKKSFESYFLEFDSGARLELMKMPSILTNPNDFSQEHIGLAHFAISVGSKATVVALTEQLRTDGYHVISNPRETGDGFFESCVADPEGNRVEITV